MSEMISALLAAGCCILGCSFELFFNISSPLLEVAKRQDLCARFMNEALIGGSPCRLQWHAGKPGKPFNEGWVALHGV